MGSLKYWVFVFALFINACGVAQTQSLVVPSATPTPIPPTVTPQIIEITRIVEIEQTVVVTFTPMPLLAQDCFNAAITQLDLNGCAAEERFLAQEKLDKTIQSIKENSVFLWRMSSHLTSCKGNGKI